MKPTWLRHYILSSTETGKWYNETLEVWEVDPLSDPHFNERSNHYSSCQNFRYKNRALQQLDRLGTGFQVEEYGILLKGKDKGKRYLLRSWENLKNA